MDILLHLAKILNHIPLWLNPLCINTWMKSLHPTSEISSLSCNKKSFFASTLSKLAKVLLCFYILQTSKSPSFLCLTLISHQGTWSQHLTKDPNIVISPKVPTLVSHQASLDLGISPNILTLVSHQGTLCWISQHKWLPPEVSSSFT